MCAVMTYWWRENENPPQMKMGLLPQMKMGLLEDFPAKKFSCQKKKVVPR